MKYKTPADPYIEGDSIKWKIWQANYGDITTCEACEKKHGTIYPPNAPSYIPQHYACRRRLVPMRTALVGTVTSEGWGGADAWLMYMGRLPDNYITKEEALDAGWNPKKGNLADVCPGKMLGGSLYSNFEEKLPIANGRVWYEADFDYNGGYRGEKRILYSNDGLVFISYDHAQTFRELIK